MRVSKRQHNENENRSHSPDTNAIFSLSTGRTSDAFTMPSLLKDPENENREKQDYFHLQSNFHLLHSNIIHNLKQEIHIGY